ncbi:MAG: heme-binding protein, partial [Gammaproteobacteria bacterium]|nr:heme-binding protein [Gammaproteobacteria bacterium]
MIEMTLGLAERVFRAARARADDIGKPFCICIVDESGRLVYQARMDGAGFFTADTSRAKAMAAASFKRSTKEITDNKDLNPLLWYSLPSVIPAQALPSPGGVPLLREGRCIGGLGIGGGTPDEDHDIAQHGAAAAAE